MSFVEAALAIVRAAATEHDPRRMARVLASRMREAMGADSALVVIVDKHGMIEVIAAEPAAPIGSLRAADYPSYEMLRAGKPMRLSTADAARYPTAKALWEEHGIRSVLAVPLVVAGDQIGGFSFGSRRDDAFAEVDLELVGELGAAIAVLVDSARAHAQLELLHDQEEAANQDLSDELRTSQSADGLIGDCAPFRSVKQLVELVGPTRATVLLAGETGSGKDVVARAIHEASPRAGRPLVTVNCAALPSTLAESELFGHEPGAFTGAIRRREGHLERASGGTLFLDEIGELPLDIQAKLLRALQERVIERVGGGEPIALDLRIIAATNRDLSQMVAAGRFREDLYYRLAVFPIEIPPLRARKEDLPGLIEFFVTRAAARLRVPARRVTPEAMAKLVAYDWPGNLRELQNAIERAMIVSTGEELEIEAMLPQRLATRGRAPTARPILPAGVAADEQALKGEYARALDECGWVIEGAQGAAARLGVHPNTLRYRLKRLGLTRPG